MTHRKLFIGRSIVDDSEFTISLEDLTTHAFILGMTGSGKTVLGKIILEEAALNGIPSIVLDLKGDLSSLALIFNETTPEGVKSLMNEFKLSIDAELYLGMIYKHNLADRIKQYRENVDFKIYTPRSSICRALSISSIPKPPPRFKRILKSEPETAYDLVESATAMITSRLGFGLDSKEAKYISEVISNLWRDEVDLTGFDGLEKLVKSIVNPPFDKIGALNVDSYISKSKRRSLASSVNDLLIGAERYWLKGEELNIESLVKKLNGKTPINIISLSHFRSFEDIQYVVSRVSYSLYNWMKEKGGSKIPRLIYYIDEIGGGGGVTALLPPHPFKSASKPILNLLLKQGRAFGLSCVFSTQNPGDVDYKALSNCGIWMIGRLQTARDREKVLEALSFVSDRSELKNILVKLDQGCFLSLIRGKPSVFKERWLCSVHVTLSPEQLEALCSRIKPSVEAKPLKEARKEKEVEKEGYLLNWYGSEYKIVKRFEGKERRWFFKRKGRIEWIKILMLPAALFKIVEYEKVSLNKYRGAIKYLLFSLERLGYYSPINSKLKWYPLPYLKLSARCLQTLAEIINLGQIRSASIGRGCLSKLLDLSLVEKYRIGRTVYVRPKIQIDIRSLTIDPSRLKLLDVNNLSFEKIYIDSSIEKSIYERYISSFHGYKSRYIGKLFIPVAACKYVEGDKFNLYIEHPFVEEVDWRVLRYLE